jgi:acetyl esterase/lipase
MPRWATGGYLTLMGGFCLKPRPAALVSFYGYGDIRKQRPDPHYLNLDRIDKEEAYKVVGGDVLSGSPISPRAIFYNYCKQNGLWVKQVTGIDPNKEAEKLKQFSPVLHVTKEYPPTLLLHGDKDRDVPFEKSWQSFAGRKTVRVFDFTPWQFLHRWCNAEQV